VNVALVSEHASPLAALGGVDSGGQNVYVAALAATLADLGHSVTVYTRRDRPDLATRVETPLGYAVCHVPAGPPQTIPKDAIYPHVAEFAAHLERLWRADFPDVVHSHFWMSGLAARAAAAPLGIPIVHTFHALGIEKRRHQGAADSSPAQRVAAETSLARTVDRIAATANAEVFDLLRMGADPHGIRVVPCGVDLERFFPGGVREARDSNLFRILTISRLVPRKGVDAVIEALAGVPDAELIVAGGGVESELERDPEGRRLTALALEKGVASRVHFRGPVEREAMPGLIRSADVVVCAPWYEPFGMVPLEAMACGVPVIASNVGGLADTIVDGVTGLHVPPRAPLAIARALELLRTDAGARRVFGRAGFKRVEAYYSWTRVAGELLDMYRSLVRGVTEERRADAS
jgi:glycosyltransferase involved in cell wall biosynthesis